MLVTIWERYNKRIKDFEHNHIEDGFNDCDKPTAISKFQEGMWRNAIWRKSLGSLVDGCVRKN